MESLLPLARVRQSGLKLMWNAWLRWVAVTNRCRGVVPAISQVRQVQSAPPVASSLLSGDQATLLTAPTCPVSRKRSVGRAVPPTFHTRAVPSAQLVARIAPLAEKLRLLILPAFVSPKKMRSRAPLAGAGRVQSRTVLSLQAVARVGPIGLKARAVTGLT